MKDRVILIDEREKGFVVEMADKYLTNFERQQIAVGDYIVHDFVIERKSLSDLYSSFFKGTLFNQLQNIESFVKENNSIGILLIEGFKYHKGVDKFKKMLNINEIMAAVLSQYENIYPVRTENGYETIMFLKHLDQYSNGDKLLDVARRANKFTSKTERQLYFLQGIPKIGQKRSKKILEKYPSLIQYFNAVVDGKETNLHLKEILGDKL